ncbi:AAA family ATPase [Mycobacterium paraintracellulare]|uniref:AAA family ATPase n=1 Tax=Mycobacterium paraintracellulare TaxID=1138383 RepID=UPI00191660FA|nr:AAA family ATPase [Mycobacterium paraintracellulare]
MSVDLTRLDTVAPEQVSWLWPGRVPLGKLVTLDGDPGLGKSTLALTMAATITRGGHWPDGTRCDHPGGVLVMSAEDGLADTIRPRLDAAGADVTRVHSVNGRRLTDMELEPLWLSESGVLRDAIEKTSARLLIIDVLMAYLSGDAHKDQDVRRILGPLARVADETACTMLLLRHLNKAKGSDPLYRGGGSIGIVGAARSGLLVAPDPDDNDVRVLTSVKHNLAARAKSWAFRVVAVNINGVDTSRVEWIGEDPRGALELMSDGDTAENFGDMTNKVLDFVVSNGEVRSAQIAKACGISGKAANQYLTRLENRKKIVRIGRGLYGPAKSSEMQDEGSEGSEGFARRILPNEDFGPGPGLGSPQNRQNLQDDYLRISG